MTDESREQLKDIFDAALQQQPENRQQFVQEKCAGDVNLQEEISSLLAALENVGSFMQDTAIAAVADVVTKKNKLEEGKYFKHYKIIKQIGVGGMGEVYLARDQKLDRFVALKILTETFSQHETNRRRFIREAKLASSLNHPNILVIHEINEENNVHFIVSEYIEGQTLREIIAASSLNLNDILEVSMQIANALAMAHEAGLVHRDLKPENIIIRPDGLVKILDFGLAKLVEDKKSISGLTNENARQNETAQGVIMGTVNYMSPEQAKGEAVDARTDIFSLGLVIYEMITGKTPFGCESISETWTKLMHTEPLPLTHYVSDVPDEIQQIISKMLRKNKDERHQTAAELRVDLEALGKFPKPGFELERNLFANKTVKLDTPSFNAATKAELQYDPPNNLTKNLSPLVGREPEIEKINNLLLQNNVGLLTLTGVGGVGKTRLSQAVAQQMLTEFPDGVFFIELASITTAELVSSTIAQSLGVTEAAGRPVLDVLKDHLREKQMLLVIDNFEQVIDAATQIAELLSAAGKLKILITSRILLHLSAEREFIVPPLAVPSEISRVSLEELSKYEAIRLFVERSQKAKPNFTLTEETARSVAEICARLDGLPLAIELAAARVKILSPSAILSKLENRLKLLTGGARDLPVRQQTMYSAVEWSYNLLTEFEKHLFRRLAVFAGGFTLDAAEGVMHSSNIDLLGKEQADEADNLETDVLNGITSLVDKSLLISKEIPNGESRFRMLEVVREFALSSLESSGEAGAVHRSHAGYFITLAEEAEPNLTGGKAVEWLNRLEDEHDNLHAALQWTFEHDPGEGARLAAAIQYFWMLHGHVTEGRRYSETALEYGVNAPPVRWKLLNIAGQAAYQQGDYQKSQVFYRRSLTDANETADKRKIALSNWGIGVTAFMLNDHAAARKFLEKSLVIGRELDDEKVLAVVVSALGELARTEGDYDKAQPFYEEAVALSKQVNNKEGIAGNLNNLGAVAYFKGDFQAAHSFYTEALAKALDLGHAVFISWAFDGFAALAVTIGDYEKAAKLAGAADALRQSIGFELETTDQHFRDYFLSQIYAKMDKGAFLAHLENGRRLNREEILALIE